MNKCIKVPKKEAEEVRLYLLSQKILSNEYKINADKKHLYIPITRALHTEEINFLNNMNIDYDVLDNYNFEPMQNRPHSHLDVLADVFSEEELELAPRSFDTIGDIVIVEIPDELMDKKEIIGEAFLKAYSSIHTVFAKSGKVSGVNRIRPVEFLAGEKKTKTIYKEHGSRFSVDITKAYFSPRLSEEHSRIAEQVKPKETIVDMFCGIGPFAIPIVKRVDARVHAIDINPNAIDLLKESLNLNKVVGSITPYTGDCREVVKKHKLNGIADRVIMNLPGYAINFVDVACNVLKESGGIMHFFEFVGGEIEPEEQIVNDIKAEVEKAKRKIANVHTVRRVRMSAPRQWQMVADVEIK